MIRIKVCGITRLDDALAAQASGADALGFVFAPSPRRVEAERVREIAGALPPFLSRVGVFVNEDRERVKEMARFCRLDVLQFHGEESPEYCRDFEQRVVKAFRVKGREDLERMKPYQHGVSAFLLDTYHPRMAGGTGRTFDWTIAAEARNLGPIVLAGGLDPDNVQAAIRAVHPYAVDVSSGVETAPGEKDHQKIRLFAERARSAL